MGVHPNRMLACGGGGTSKLWRQMLADVLGCPVSTCASKEGPALGVAILAGVGCGAYSSVEQGCEAVIRVNDPQPPIAQNQAEYARVYDIYRALYPSLKAQYAALAEL